MTTAGHDQDFTGLSALFINCTLKKSPELSHTQGLIDVSEAIMRKNGVATEVIRAVDFDIPPGVWPDMSEHGWDHDDWPGIYEKVTAADILVLGSAIWLGEKTSVCTKVIERLYAASHLLNDKGQYAYYGRVGGALITGNEDGAKHCAMNILYSLQHLGYVIDRQRRAGKDGNLALLRRERLHHTGHGGLGQHDHLDPSGQASQALHDPSVMSGGVPAHQLFEGALTEVGFQRDLSFGATGAPLDQIRRRVERRL